MGWDRVLCPELVIFTFTAEKKNPENLRRETFWWRGLLLRNNIGRTAQHVSEERKIYFLCVYMEPWMRPKSFKLVWRCNHLLFGFPTNGHFPRVSHYGSQRANDKGDGKVKSVPFQRSPVIYLTSEENPGKLQLGDHLKKALRTVIASIRGLISKWRR